MSWHYTQYCNLLYIIFYTSLLYFSSPYIFYLVVINSIWESNQDLIKMKWWRSKAEKWDTKRYIFRKSWRSTGWGWSWRERKRSKDGGWKRGMGAGFVKLSYHQIILLLLFYFSSFLNMHCYYLFSVIMHMLLYICYLY